MHHEIWKYYQIITGSTTQVLQNLNVLCSSVMLVFLQSPNDRGRPCLRQGLHWPCLASVNEIGECSRDSAIEPTQRHHDEKSCWLQFMEIYSHDATVLVFLGLQ